MPSVYFQFRDSKLKKPQMLYLGYKFGHSQILYPIGIKLNPTQCNFEKGKLSIKNVAFLEGGITKKNLPKVDESFKFNYEQITTILTHFKTKVTTYTTENIESLTKDSLRTFIDGLYLPKNEFLSAFVNKLFNHLNSILVDTAKKGIIISENEMIELTEKYLAQKKQTKSIFEFIDGYILDIKNGNKLNDGAIYNNGTVQRYSTTRALLLEFRPNLTFEGIDNKFENELNSYMAKVKNYKVATMGKHIGTIKTFLREAQKLGLHKNITFQDFKVLTDESDSIALNPIEIEGLYNLDLTENKRLEVVRDMFVLGCHSGLRWSDFTDIKPENIKQGSSIQLIDIIQFKTKEQVVIPINNTISEILIKYNYQLPKPISNQKFNDYIKEVAQMVALLNVTETKAITKGGRTYEQTKYRWELISSHTARRSFATNAFEKGIDTKLIRAITGHKSEKSFLGYIKTSKTKQAEMFGELNK